jgi:hypothetical protein
LSFVTLQYWRELFEMACPFHVFNSHLQVDFVVRIWDNHAKKFLLN